ncbi:hypothetical protein [Pantoea stewartii]|uniref:Uncharacterized protein n=1 Tax=Pantoea stewartii subsp. stewartii DC283 TaxID=660596 RepID=H3R911_PANSE|nr:hypothetical protein [Pantoea stewartii]ARF51136.1 hypothetical protein DSJ_18645 [Pantoea stewartii subsp. stewartii DC283]EHU01674.1 hypothetical protein CKS_0109 [Pantoea stewartii subsp. stewartii DC283]KAB0558956.1 hypothetical protein F7Q90_03365 [Pantoea stewartii subsp. stewartii]
MEMYSLIYKPTDVPVGLFVDAENVIKRCKFLSDSKDFVVFKVQVTELQQVKFSRHGEAEEMSSGTTD